MYRNTIIVTGLPRSGTSLCMQMLAAAGIPVLIDHPENPLADAREMNPNGFYEYSKIAWVNGLSNAIGKAVKIIAYSPVEFPREAKYLVMRRHAVEIAMSQETSLEKINQEILDFLKRIDGLNSLEVWYHDLIFNPVNEIARVSEFLGGNLDIEAMASVVNPSHYRNRKELA